MENLVVRSRITGPESVPLSNITPSMFKSMETEDMELSVGDDWTLHIGKNANARISDPYFARVTGRACRMAVLVQNDVPVIAYDYSVLFDGIVVYTVKNLCPKTWEEYVALPEKEITWIHTGLAWLKRWYSISSGELGIHGDDFHYMTQIRLTCPIASDIPMTVTVNQSSSRSFSSDDGIASRVDWLKSMIKPGMSHITSVLPSVTATFWDGELTYMPYLVVRTEKHTLNYEFRVDAYTLECEDEDDIQTPLRELVAWMEILVHSYVQGVEEVQEVSVLATSRSVMKRVRESILGSYKAW